MFGSDDNADTDDLIHIVAPPNRHSDLSRDIENMQERGFLEDYEVIITDYEVGVYDFDLMAEALADRLDGVEVTDNGGSNEKPDGYTMIGDDSEL